MWLHILFICTKVKHTHQKNSYVYKTYKYVYIFILSTKLIQKNQNTYVDKQKTIFFLMKKTENKIFTA